MVAGEGRPGRFAGFFPAAKTASEEFWIFRKISYFLLFSFSVGFGQVSFPAPFSSLLYYFFLRFVNRYFYREKENVLFKITIKKTKIKYYL